ncbi:TIM barrel protein [candidate division KSB1 bacterium]|nr:TIM barrel protein [candidate division KSB1 bacterium]
MNRRTFLELTSKSGLAAGLAFLGCQSGEQPATEPLYKISLAEWSVNRQIFGGYPQQHGWEKFAEMLHSDPSQIYAQGELKNLDFPALARSLGIEAVEYVNTCFFDKAKDTDYLQELKNRCDSEGVKSLLIMCDQEGALGAPDEEARTQAIENHYKWVDAAQFLGCHAIRVNAASEGSYEEQQKLAANGLSRLADYAGKAGIDVLVENHGGLSSNGQWLAGVMMMADHPRVGTLPDFGNFRVSPEETYDRYKGVAELMPWARAVSAKSHEFDENGNEIHTDYNRMMKIVLDAGYRGYVGIEYEGTDPTALEGIRMTKALLERVREELAPQYL